VEPKTACAAPPERHVLGMTATHVLNDFQLTEFPRRVLAMNEAQPGFADAFYAMEKLLVSKGGAAVVPMPEELDSIQALLAHAEYERPLHVRTHILRKSACHANSAKLWAESLGQEKIWSGYALSMDGLWRQHSWARDERGIIETTEIRVAYYGVEMSFRDSVKMLIANCDVEEISPEVFQSEFWGEVTALLQQFTEQL
jgi:hypothetical protein